jgi:predicted ATP-grasp superfamily ATP-dependent carboligase
VHLPDEVRCEIERLGILLVDRFNLRGLFGVDVIVDADKRIWILEVNPRYTASMELLEHPDRAPLEHFSGKAILYAKRSTCVSAKLAETWMQRWDVADIPAARSELAVGSPVVSLFAHGQTEAEVLAKLESKAMAQNRELLHAGALSTATR